jgi:oligopeptide transport system ATP-binding protein
MYKGRIVELADSATLFADPLHPYTKCLMAAVPEPKPGKGQRFRYVRRNDASASGSQPACACSSWCPDAAGECSKESPELREARPGHFVACHLAD